MDAEHAGGRAHHLRARARDHQLHFGAQHAKAGVQHLYVHSSRRGDRQSLDRSIGSRRVDQGELGNWILSLRFPSPQYTERTGHLSRMICVGSVAFALCDQLSAMGQNRRSRQRLSTPGPPSTAELLTDSKHLRSVLKTRRSQAFCRPPQSARSGRSIFFRRT
jgi:hypothetical protein